MKIGFSFGRCLRDIVNETVDYQDVYLVISRTAIYDSSQIEGVVEMYLDRPGYLLGLDEGKCYDYAIKLMTDGKLFQPRVTFGKNPMQVAEDHVWMDLAPTITGEDAASEQVTHAWKQYQLALKMTSLKQFPDKPRFDLGF
jgi:hypothetical protein